MRLSHTRQAPPKRRAPISKLGALPTSAVLTAVAAVIVGSGAAVVSVSSADAAPPSDGAVLTANLADSIVDTTPQDDGWARNASSRTSAISRAADREALQLQQQQSQQAVRAADRRSDAIAELVEKTRAEAERIDANEWVLPTEGYTLTATFGESSGLWSTTHTGLDFAAPSGARVVAVSSGTITSTAYDGAYGNRTILTLTDGTEIWYCHQTSFVARKGQQVTPGQLIGYVGSTGNSTGPHLHLEVRPGGRNPVDPYAALAAHGVRP